MKREEDEGEHKKRAPNKYIMDLTALKAFIKIRIPNENLSNVGAMSKVCAKLLSGNDKDLEKAKKAFNLISFLRDYKAAEAGVIAKRAAKKAAKV